MIARLREEWDQDTTRKFQALYGEDARRQSADLDQQRELALRIVDMPASEEDVAQMQDGEAAPRVPDKAYQVVNPVTGEPEYIKLGTPEARAHWKKVTTEFYTGKNKIVMDYMDAAAQYPNSPGIQRLAKGMFDSMVQAVENEKNTQLMAQREQEMQESDERMAAQREARERQGIKDKAAADYLRGQNSDQYEGMSDVEVAATEEAKNEYLQGQAQAAQNQQVLAQSSARSDEGRRRAIEEQGIQGARNWDDAKAEEFLAQDELRLKALHDKSKRALEKGEPLPMEIAPETVRSSIETSKEYENRLKVKLGSAERERAALVSRQAIVEFNKLDPQTRKLAGNTLADLEEKLNVNTPPVDAPAIELELKREMIEAAVVNSPDWVSAHKKGADTTFDLLGKVAPQYFPEYVKADKRYPLSETNNVAHQRFLERQKANSPDPQSEPEPVSNEPMFPHYAEEWAAPAPERVEAANKVAEQLQVISKSRDAKGLFGTYAASTMQPGPYKVEKMTASEIKLHLKVLYGARLEKAKLFDTMAEAQTDKNQRIADGAYESQYEDVELAAERIERNIDFLESILPVKTRREAQARERRLEIENARRAKKAREQWIKDYKAEHPNFDPEDPETKEWINRVYGSSSQKSAIRATLAGK